MPAIARGEWSATTTYRSSDRVIRLGLSYRASAGNIGQAPEAAPSLWSLISSRVDQDELLDTLVELRDITPAALNATYVPKWQANTAYTAGQYVLSPAGQIVQAIAAFTSAAAYAASDWTVITGGTAASVRDSIYRNGVPIANRTEWPSTGNLSNGADLGGTFRVRHIVAADSTSFRLVYSNAVGISPGPNAITVRASVEFSITALWPVFFNGARDVKIEPGGIAVSDPVGPGTPLSAAAVEGPYFPGVPATQLTKATIWSRTYVTVATTGDKWPLGILTDLTGEGNNRSLTPTDLTLTGTVGAAPTDRAYSPTAITGNASNPARRFSPAIGMIGDSILTGVTSFPIRAFRAVADVQQTSLAALVNLSLGGDEANEGTGEWMRRPFLEGLTHAIVNYFANDVRNVSAAVCQSRLTGVWKWLAGRGIVGFQTTGLPQTILTAPQVIVRNDLNTWLRAGAPLDPVALTPVAVGTAGAVTCPVYNAAALLVQTAVGSTHPLAGGIIEIGDRLETARQSNLWVAGMDSGDGAHPSRLGHVEAAKAIPRAAFGITIPGGAVPSTVSGLVADYDPTISPPADGTALASVPNQIAGLGAMTQAAATKPIYKSGVVNGHGVFRFNGTSEFFNLPNLSALTAATFIIAVRKAADPAVSELRAGLWHVGGAGNISWAPYTDGIIYDSAGKSTGFNSVLKPVETPMSAWSVYTIIAGAGVWKAYLNGILLSNPAALLSPPAANVFAAPAAGFLGKNGSSTSFLDGDVARFLVYDRTLSDAEHKSVARGLGSRFLIDVA